MKVRADWDPEAAVWVATSDDIPGLVTEAGNHEELRRKLVDLIPELLTENGIQYDPSDPPEVEVISRELISFAA